MKKKIILNIKQILALVLMIMLLPLVTRAQVSLNLEQCRSLALKYSHMMQIAAQQMDKAKFDKKSYKAKYFPSISATGTYFYKPGLLEYQLTGGYLPTYIPGADGQLIPNLLLDGAGQPVTGPDGVPVFKQYAYMPDTDLKLGLEGVGMAAIQLQQPVYMGGKIRSANKMATLASQIANENMRLNKADVITEADEAYWQYIDVKEKLKSAKEYARLLDELHTNVKNAVDVGMATRNDLLKVQVKKNEATLMVQKANNGLELSSMNLCRIIGLPFETAIEINDSLQTKVIYSADETQSTVTQRPEYQMMEKDIAIKNKQVDLVRSDFLPQVGIMASYSYFDGMQFNGNTSNDASFSALARVSIPIFNWGEGRNKVQSARAEQKICEAKLEQYQQLMALEIAQARFNMKDAKTKVTLTQSSLEQAEENLKISAGMYETGMESLSDHLEAQAQKQQARSEYIDACAQLKLSETHYLKATGKLDQIELPTIK